MIEEAVIDSSKALAETHIEDAQRVIWLSDYRIYARKGLKQFDFLTQFFSE